MTCRACAIDLFCGLGGWTEGLLAEGYDVTGYDIEAHEYDGERYPATLILRDVLDIHGSEFARADLIVASPPCQEYSWMAMPWSRAKQVGRALRGDDEFPDGYKGSRTIEDLNRLFNACFRIQREASEAAGRHIPMVVENVRGAIPWVGRSRWNYGSFHLWGDVPALMPSTAAVKLGGGASWYRPSDARHTPGLDFTRLAGRKNNVDSWSNIGAPGKKVVGMNPDGRLVHRRDGHPHTKHLNNPDEHAAVADTGVKIGGDWFSDPQSTCRKHGSGSLARPPPTPASPRYRGSCRSGSRRITCRMVSSGGAPR